MEKFNSLPNVFPLGFYHPKSNYDGDYYEDNEYFNEYSQKILNLKNSDYEAIIFFF
ncbi:MAG: hypothetical protein QNJ64_01435 [Crocosphaera sp.]|nr:hypothetical protein [Crocosphaera sp.]